MLRDAAVVEVQRVLGYRSDKTAEILELMLTQQAELERQVDLPWFLRSQVTTLQCIANQDTMFVPTGFLKEWNDDPLQVETLNSSGTALIWKRLDKDVPIYLRETLQEQSPGVPQAYSRIVGYFQLFPTPDAVYNFRLTYYKEAALLTSNIENVWLSAMPYLLIGRVGLRIAAATRDKDAIQTFGAMVQEGMGRINNWNTEIEQTGARLVVGGPD